jgi:DNA helicase-2/ATP-dependent DNA helicase PcrA
MKLTEEQKRAVRLEHSLMLAACPGSGKTRVIISKIIRALEDVRDTPRGVACITYTNAAVHEIESRVHIYMQPDDERFVDICTIHSFCLNSIFRPFRHLVPGYKKGFQVLTQDNEEFEEHVREICSRHGRLTLQYKDFEEFTQLRVGLDGEPCGAVIERGAITIPMAKEYWNRIRAAGFIDFANIVYQSLRLLRGHAEVLDHISSKFPWILVDEFQDTTDLQVEILSLIASKRKTRFLLVGDRFQSIFRFAGARPNLADDFAAKIGARTDLGLSGNFRSSVPIINQAERLFARTPPMHAVGDSTRFTEAPEWRHGARAFDVLAANFLPTLERLEIPIGDAAVLAPDWFTLFPLGKLLRNAGVAIVGPGARPYRRGQFALIAEAVCGYLIDPRPSGVIGIERTLFNTLLDITGRPNFGLFSYHGRTVVFRLVQVAKKLHSADSSAIKWLESAAAAFSEILIDEHYISPNERMRFAYSVTAMKADMVKNRVDPDSLTIGDLGVYASPDAALKLSTLHNAKGREYAAVAMVNLHERAIPSWHSRTPDDYAEQKRLFYVGVTRAKRYLLYITDDSGRGGPSRYLLEAEGVGASLH